MKTALLVHHIGQVQVLKEFLPSVSEQERKHLRIIALGADIESMLEESGTPFMSGRELRKVSHFECLLHAERIGREVLSDESLSFFSYRNVSLATIFTPALQVYLQSALYFMDVVTTIAETLPEFKKIILFPDTRVLSETDSVLDPLGMAVAIDAARLVGDTYGIEIVVPVLRARATRARMRREAISFNVKRRLFGWGLFVMNAFISFVRPAKKIRIIASDYWKHISPLMDEMPEAELLLLDRSEILHAGFAAIWKNRMRFIHVEDYVSGAMKKDASHRTREFIEEWTRVRSENVAIKHARFLGHDLASLLSNAVQRIFEEGVERSLHTIDGSYALYERMHPDVVLVRASFSLQVHFPILCYVARQLGVPSIEVQHGILYLGPGTFISKPAPEYIATYGPLTSSGFKAFGYTDEKLLNIGSPRFDEYKTMRERSSGMRKGNKPFTVTCIVPAVLPRAWSDSYEVQKYFFDLTAAVVNIPNVLLIFKLRPSSLDEAFYRKTIPAAFGKIPFRIAQYEPLVDLIEESDAIVTIHSTTTLEGLISGRPVIYNATLEFHKALGAEFQEYEAAGALMIAYTPEGLSQSLGSLAKDPELRATMVQCADVFMRENYSFDGGASVRLADSIRALTLPAKKE